MWTGGEDGTNDCHTSLSVGNVLACLESITDYFAWLFCFVGGHALGGALALLGCLVLSWGGLVVSLHS